MTLLVSVIIPLYKCEAFIAQALQSVLDQTFHDFEIIVVNDGSPDNSHDSVQPFLQDSRIRYVTQDNQGAAEARNKGISLVRGQYIALLDCDDVWLPNKLQLQVDYLERHPECVLVHGDVECIDFHGKMIQPPHVSWLLPGLLEKMDGDVFQNLFMEPHIVPSTAVIRAAALNPPEVFRQRFFPADDYDLWLRLARKGRFGLIKQKLAQYRWHGGNFSSNWIKIDVSTLEVLENLLIEHPTVRKEITPAVINARLHTLYYTIATEYSRRQDWNTASQYWKKSIATRPSCLKCLFMFMLGLIPTHARRSIFWWLHKYGPTKPKPKPKHNDTNNPA